MVFDHFALGVVFIWHWLAVLKASLRISNMLWLH